MNQTFYKARKDAVWSKCLSTIKLSSQSIHSGYLSVSDVISPILHSICHGYGWKIFVELEREFGINQSEG